MRRALVFVARSSEAWLAPRTVRSLAAAGFAPEVVSSLDSLAGDCLLARAGAWLLDPRPPFLADAPGWVGIGLGTGRRWRAVQARSSGDLRRLRWPRRRLPDMPPFVWLPAAAAAALRQAGRTRRSLRHAVERLVFGGELDAVCVPGLNGAADPRLRLVHAVTSIHVGGAEKIAVESAAGLCDRGTATLLAALGKPRRDELPRPPCFVELADAPDRIPALDAAALRFGADLIHAHLLRAEDLKELAQRGWPVVAALHNMRCAWPEGIDGLRAGDAALMVACSRAVTADWERCGSMVPARTVWNGVEPCRMRAASAGEAVRRRLGVPQNDLVLLSLANARPQKRLDRLPAILAACRDRRAGVHLVAAGSGTLDLPAADGCHRLGLVAEPAPLIAACDVLISPSAHEGLSLAQLEALAAGKRVVATDVGGAGEVPGIHVVPAQATDAELAAAALAAAADPAPGGLPASFTRDAMLSRLLWLYPRVLSRHRLRGQPAGADVWLVTNNFFTGGAQASARRLLSALHARGHRVRAVTLEEGGSVRSRGRACLELAGIPVFTPPAPGFPGAEAVARSVLEAMDACPPRAVLFWNAIASAKVLLADALIGTRIIDVSPGEMWYTSFARCFRRPRTGLPYRSSREYGQLLAGAVVKYEAERERAAAELGCPVHVIPNGVPRAAEGRRAERNGVLILGTAARLSPDKRLEELLDGVRLAHSRLPRYELWIAGGPDGAGPAHARALRRRAGGLPVRWLGETDGADELLDRTDVFVSISEPAGCPNASLEALAHGVPVLATDHGGAAEQVLDGVTGRLVPRSDAGALAAALIELAADGALRARLGAAARRHVAERFSLEAMVSRYERLLWPAEE